MKDLVQYIEAIANNLVSVRSDETQWDRRINVLLFYFKHGCVIQKESFFAA